MSSSRSRVPACLMCRQKKILCDRNSPSCSPCLKNGLACSYPTKNKRYIVSRERSCKECRRRRAKCDRKQSCSSCATAGVKCVYTTSESYDHEEELNQINDSSPPRRRNSVSPSLRLSVDHDDIPVYPSLLLGFDTIPVSLTELHPTIAHIWLLWDIFSQNVDPLFKLFHAQSIHRRLLSAVQDLGSIDGDLEALLFAVYFAGIVVQDDSDCLTKFRQSKVDLLKKYRYALEQCFARSRDQASVISLQALVLFLIMTHYSPLSAPTSSLLALTIGLALRLNVHQDPLHAPRGLPSYPTIADRTSAEMRRRLWWYIMILDVQYAQSTKTDPVISETMWTTKFPGNFDDGELDDSSELPIPPPMGETFDLETFATQAATIHGGEQETRTTDISFALLRIEIMNAHRRYGFSEQFCLNNGYSYLSTPTARIQFLEDLVKRVNQKYLQLRRGNDFLGFFQRNAVKLILSKHLMLAKQDGPVRERLHNCVQVLEAAAGIRKTHPAWAWVLRQPVELDSLAQLWECLAAYPGTEQLDGNLEWQHAWRLAEKATESAERDNLAACYPTEWSRIQVLSVRAIEVRSLQTHTGSRGGEG